MAGREWRARRSAPHQALPACAPPCTAPARQLIACPALPPLLPAPSCYPGAAQLDLHFLSVVGARIVLRGWLLHLKRRALRGEQLDPGFKFRIVTGGSQRHLLPACCGGWGWGRAQGVAPARWAAGGTQPAEGLPRTAVTL